MKPGREDQQPNLGSTDYPGWFQWGQHESLISARPESQKYRSMSWARRTFIPRQKNRFMKAKNQFVRYFR